MKHAFQICSFDSAESEIMHVVAGLGSQGCTLENNWAALGMDEGWFHSLQSGTATVQLVIVYFFCT